MRLSPSRAHLEAGSSPSCPMHARRSHPASAKRQVPEVGARAKSRASLRLLGSSGRMLRGKTKREEYIFVEGVRYSISHLHDAVYRYPIKGSAGHSPPECDALVQCSSQRITWGPKRGKKIDFSTHGEDRRITDERGVHRCFDETRHSHSTNLVRIFGTLTDRQCIFTGSGNFVTAEIMEIDGEGLPYEVYFRIARQGSTMVRIYVQSAYVRDTNISPNRPSFQRRHEGVSGRVLLAKTLRGEPVARQRTWKRKYLSRS